MAMSYKLVCAGCSKTVQDEYTLLCPHCDSILRTEYEGPFKPLEEPGLGRYRSWLPVPDDFTYPAAPVVYKSEGLANELGLNNLWIAFNGYWPERGADLRSCTFKELEAPPTFARAKACGAKTMILASAGNTGRAFAYVGGKLGFPTVVLIPNACRETFWLPEEKADCVKLIAVDDADYFQTIQVAERIGKLMGFQREGGHKNVARKDGMSIVVMAGYEVMMKLPMHYFQAVGSGTGALGSYEFYNKLFTSGVREKMPKFHLVQGSPFIPMVKAWRDGRDTIVPDDFPQECQDPGYLIGLFAKVLTNRSPPFGGTGGVHEVLSTSKGQMYGVEEEMAKIAGKMFERSEGIDLVPAAQVCVGGLLKALDEGEVGKDDEVLLNITGGGEARYDKEVGKKLPNFDFRISGPDALDDELRWPFDE